jgi:hypothetical protein
LEIKSNSCLAYYFFKNKNTEDVKQVLNIFEHDYFIAEPKPISVVIAILQAQSPISGNLLHLIDHRRLDISYKVVKIKLD